MMLLKLLETSLMNYKIEILGADPNFKDAMGDRYIRYSLKINGDSCQYLLAKSPVQSYFYTYPKEVYNWPSERADDLRKLEKQVEAAIETYEFKKTLSNDIVKTFGELIDEL